MAINQSKKWRLTPMRVLLFALFVGLFVFTNIYQHSKFDELLKSYPVPTDVLWKSNLLQILSVIVLALSFAFIIPKKGATPTHSTALCAGNKSLPKSGIISIIMTFIAMPLTILAGVYLLQDRKFYFISLLLMIEVAIPFIISFEKGKSRTKDIVIISVLCALAVASRQALFMLPYFKPVAALVIITGICLGGETGFIVGAISMFVSNFFLAQGSWTPWQMFAMGILGFLGWLFFKLGLIKKTRTSLSIFGFFAVLLVYGFIMNSNYLIYLQNPSFKDIANIYLLGMPGDLLHGASTAFFMWYLSEPMIEKLERIKTKYGLRD
ncbi:MAG: ECF transporter S component [Eubacteriales bacterium]|nr:ECF transporter S component [Eubacteriales bacterium]